MKINSRITHTQNKRLATIGRPHVFEHRRVPVGLIEDRRHAHRVGSRARPIVEEKPPAWVDLALCKRHMTL